MKYPTFLKFLQVDNIVTPAHLFKWRNNTTCMVHEIRPIAEIGLSLNLPARSKGGLHYDFLPTLIV